MTVEEAIEDLRATVEAHKSPGFFPPLAAWAHMCDMDLDPWMRRLKRLENRQLRDQARQYIREYKAWRLEEYKRLRAAGVVKSVALLQAGVGMKRGNKAVLPARRFFDWPALFAAHREWLREWRRTDEVAERLGVTVAGLRNLAARVAPSGVEHKRVGHWCFWRIKSRGSKIGPK